MSRLVKLLLIIAAIMLLLITASLVFVQLTAVGSGDDVEMLEETEETTPETDNTGFFYCSVEIRDDLHTPNAFFGVVETYPADNDAQWPVIFTESHTAETLGYTLIEIRGISVPSQFADRSRPLVFTERERTRFDKAMSYTWMLLSHAEVIILRNPEATESGTVRCDVSIRIGGQELDLSEMLIADGHARPIGDWDWGGREVSETIKE